MKSKTVLIQEEREKLFNYIYKLEELGYTQSQIGAIVGDYKQVISNIKTKENYPISVKKASALNEKIEQFLTNLNNGCNN